MDNMIDEDVLIPTCFMHNHDFDIIAWYSEHCQSVLGLPRDEDGGFNTFSNGSDDSNSNDSDAGPDRYGEGVAVFVAGLPQKDIFVVDSGVTEHCFRKHEDFIKYTPVSCKGTAAEGSKFQILVTGVV